MKGTRPLDNNEIRRVSACFIGTYEVHNRRLGMVFAFKGKYFVYMPHLAYYNFPIITITVEV